MGSYLIKRILVSLITVFLVTVFVFLIIRMQFRGHTLLLLPMRLFLMRTHCRTIIAIT